MLPNSFSKYFSTTGWRVGWMVLPEALIRSVEYLTQNLFISAPDISQVAAEAAFDCHDEPRASIARRHAFAAATCFLRRSCHASISCRTVAEVSSIERRVTSITGQPCRLHSRRAQSNSAFTASSST